MTQLENMQAIEKRLWGAADTLRANSNYASNEYFMPVMGLIFLRHAYSRFLKVKEELVATLPTRGGRTRELTKEDFSQKSSIYLQEKSQFDYLVSLPDSADRAGAIIEAMDLIEADYETLRGVLPKAEYQELSKEVLGLLLRTLNPEELKQASGDIFGRIYEYFLTQFADQKAHDGGEFFTPVSLVSLIANVLEPERGKIIDPACGSGGMFVQSANFVERLNVNPNERLTFYGLEKNPTTIRLGKMNLAVHGLEGDIQKAISYYEDPHELLGKADYVMANPPFNVDEVDAEQVKNDPRLPFGLPGVNKNGKVTNGNYLWISYFYSYLKETGRAGFVMSSQASSAGQGEAEVRRKLIETGDVDIMVSIRSNFFYTRTVPCELWFLNRAKPETLKDKVLMIDARNIYRKVTRKIYDFSPEQVNNLLTIVSLYRGQKEKFTNSVAKYLDETLNEARKCLPKVTENVQEQRVVDDYVDLLQDLITLMKPFLDAVSLDEQNKNMLGEVENGIIEIVSLIEEFHMELDAEEAKWSMEDMANLALLLQVKDRLSSLTDRSRELIKRFDHLLKILSSLIDVCESKLSAKENSLWPTREIKTTSKKIDTLRQIAVEQLKQVRYYYKQAVWLVERFPDGELKDIDGLVKLVNKSELESNDWSLTPGRYVGVASEEEDGDFNFEEKIREIFNEFETLNLEAEELSAKIRMNLEELGL